jgi:autotransporter-associated beta strand protein
MLPLRFSRLFQRRLESRLASRPGNRLVRRSVRRFTPLVGERLEPRLPLAVLVNSGTAADVVYTLPSAANVVFLEDGGVAGDGLVQLRSGNGAFDTTVFPNPSGSLTIKRGNVADTLTISNLADFTASLLVGGWIGPFTSVTMTSPITLAAGKDFTAYGKTQLLAAAGGVTVSGGGKIELSVDSLTLNATPSLSAGSGIVTIEPQTTGTPVNLGTLTAGQLSLTDEDLNRIVAGTLRIGDNPFGGPITVSSAINVANNPAPIGALHLYSGGGVANALASGTAITATSLAISGFSGSGSATTLTTQVSNLAASYTGGYGLSLSNTGALNITTVDGISGVRSTGGGIAVTSAGALTVSSSSGSNPGPTQITAAGTDQLLTINSTLTGLGDLTLTADRVALNATVNFGSAKVTLLPATSGRAIDLGSATDIAAGTLELSSDELSEIAFSDVQIGNATSGAITISSPISLAGKNVTLVTGAGMSGSGAIINGSATAVTVTFDQAGDSAYGGALGGPSTGTANDKNLSFAKAGSGTLTKSGISNYSGTTTVHAGTLKVGTSAIPAASDVTIDAGATLNLAGSLTAIGALNGGGAVTQSYGGGITAFQVTGGGNFAGSISGVTDLNVNGAGKTLTLSGASTLHAFVVNAGTLLVNGTISTSNLATVYSGGTLGGAGIINTNPVAEIEVQSGGHLAPGASGPGVFTTNSIRLDAGANYDVVLNGTAVGTQYSQQRVTGTPVIVGPFSYLNLTLGYPPAVGDSFTIVRNDTSSPVAGPFRQYAEGALITATTGAFTATFQITYKGGDGNDVVLTAVDPNLVVTGTASDDAWLARRNGSNVDISQNGTLLYSVPFSSFSTLTFSGQAGSDTLAVDLSAGDVIPSGGLTLNGGDPTTGPGDKLVILGGSQGTVTYNYANAHDGSIVMSNFGTVNYTGLEPIINSGTAAEMVVNLPAGLNALTFGDDGASGNGLSRLSAATIETTDFANPTGSLTINPASAADTLTLNSLPDFSAGLTIGSAANPVGSLTFAGALTLAADQDLVAFSSAKISLPNAASDLATSGRGSISLTSSRNINIAAGASVSTVDGGITFLMNQQAMPLAGNFSGIILSGTLTTSGAGDITLVGRGGDDPATSLHIGIDILRGVVRSTSTLPDAGRITLLGQGGAGTSDNDGVAVEGVGASVESVVGGISITGYGGSGTTIANRGVMVINGGQVKSTGTGLLAADITLVGTGGSGTDSGRGTQISGTDAVVSTVDGDISITGTGNTDATGSFVYGVLIFSGGEVKSTGTGPSAGTIFISGAGGGSGASGSNQNIGVRIESAGTLIDSVDGDITILGEAETLTPNNYVGVSLVTSAAIQIAGSGRLDMTGVGGVSGSQITAGVRLSSTIDVAGVAMTITADRITIDATSAVTVASTMLLRPLTAGRAISVGTDDTSTQLGLTGAELDRITAGTLQIGDADSGPITISADITRQAATNVSLASGGAISFVGGALDTGGGNLLIAPGSSASASFPHAGVDVLLGAGGTLSFAGGANLAIAINGAAVDAGFEQLSVLGKVDLTGVRLALSGARQALGQPLTIVNNGGANNILGSFAGLLDGQAFSIASGPLAGLYGITYHGGDGNDAVLTAINTPPAFSTGPDQNSTDESGPQLIAGWATGIAPGPPGEAAQQIHFVIQANTNPSLFAALPAIDASGNLSFAPAPNASGSAQITIVLQDDGGTASGGSDTSTQQVFAINIAKPHAWHNVARPTDVDNDTFIAPKDALAIINYINSIGSGAVPAGMPVTYYYDASGDNFIAPNDALLVINFINVFGAGEGEGSLDGPFAGSAVPTGTRAAGEPLSADLLTLLAFDTAPLGLRRRV